MNPWNSEERESKVDALDRVARVGKALAHGTRVSMLELLAQADRPVGELAEHAGVKLTTASAHLQILRDAGLVTTRRQGSAVVCSLAGDHVASVLLGLYDLVAPRASAAPDGDGGHGGQTAEIVLDVRPPEEYLHGHVDGAVNVPVETLAARLEDLPADASYVVYCRGRFCSLSHDAAEILRTHGRAVRVSDIGVLEWRALDAELVS